MESPERRACSRAAASDFSDGSIPVTLAPSAASVSARIPPPQPTSKTRFPPNPPNTRRKYSTRTAFSSCSPANGPSSLHHTPGTRSTRRSYFSGSERPPRRGSCCDMGTNLWRGGGWGRFRGGWWRWLPGEGPIELPREEAGTTLAVVQGRPILVKPYHFAARWALPPPLRPPPTSTHLHHPSQPPLKRSLPRWGTAPPRGTTAPPGASSCPPRRATGPPRALRWQPAGAPHGYGARIRWHSFPP